MNLIKERDARTRKRQRAKDKVDSKITLSSFLPDLDSKNIVELSMPKPEGKVRLLDEGAILTAGGKVDIYIERGVLRKFVEGRNEYITPEYLVHDKDLASRYFIGDVTKPLNINDKYEGAVKMGHMDFAENPAGLVGSWKKEDLTLVDNGEGREGLDVELKLNEEHPLVQALRVQGIPVGVSVEMYLHFDPHGSAELERSVPEENKGWWMEAVDEIFIKDFAIVGECGNVGSSGSVDLEGVTMKDTDKDIENEAMPTDDVEDTQETPTEETPVEATEDDTTEDEGGDEADTNEADGDDGEGEEDALAVAEETITSLRSEIAQLNEQVEALKKSNTKKDKKIRDYAERDAEFAKKFKGLDVSLGVTKKEAKEEKKVAKLYATGDGIGE